MMDICKYSELATDAGSSDKQQEKVSDSKRGNNCTIPEIQFSHTPKDRQANSDSKQADEVKGRFTVTTSPLKELSQSALQSSLIRIRSCSEQDIHKSSLTVPAIRPRSGSLISLTNIRSGNKQYIPVSKADEYKDYFHIPRTQHDTINSFADFIQVSSKKKSSSSKPPFTFAKSPTKNMRRRLVYKNGECNVTNKHIRKVKRHYLADIFTTLIDLKWRWSLVIFMMSFVMTWVLFAFIWWIIGFTHHDFDEGKTHASCVEGVEDFVTAFLFSLETQHTIGYGTRSMNSDCPEAIIVLMIQSITGVLSQALVTGMIFAKLSRPKKRAETLMFSKDATICLRDGHLCLMFRIGDMRSSHLVEAHVRAMVIRRRVTKEGEVLPLDHQDVNVGFDNGTDRLLIMWPVIVIHKIDKDSPFWRMSQADLERENFELIVVLEGTIESTGMTTQARTSYLPGEILWGRRLERLVTFQKEGGQYQVDYTRFDNTVPVDTPSCSAKDLAAMRSSDSDDDSNSTGEEFTLMRANSVQTSDNEESDVLLIPDGAYALEMFEMNGKS